MLNWHVQDSMGPDGKGKETVRPFTVYVVKDGEILKAPHKQNVRLSVKNIIGSMRMWMQTL